MEIIDINKIKFKKFKKIYGEYLEQVSFKLNIVFDFFKVNTASEAEVYDFLYMRDCLQKIYDRAWDSSIAFNTLEGQLIIKFTKSPYNENIIVQAELYNTMRTGKLQIEYLIDRISLPPIINAIDTIFMKME